MPPPIQALGRWTRLSLLILAAGLVGLLGVARRLEPDPRGFGTHQQLGLAPCSFRLGAGYNCPTCGMTTAFAWFTRAEPRRSWDANPAGLAIAASLVAVIPWMAVVAWRGTPWLTRSIGPTLAAGCLALAAFTVLVWIFRLVFEWRVLG